MLLCRFLLFRRDNPELPMIDQYLQSMILRERGNNRKLSEEILEKLSTESKERLFRILKDKEDERNHLERKASRPWIMR